MTEMENPPFAGLLVKDVMQSQHLSAAEVAEAIHVSPSSLSRILTGKSAITSEMAIRLEKALHISSRLLLDMQTACCLAQARKTVCTDQIADLIAAKQNHQTAHV